ncbi:hypothetical protein [Desulfovibrio sp. SGI.169]|uniref:hypothetical protein n=1 Tax=Desulfovibrio sp. SGI.169 TaxID=3420561 RepID=UPI003D0006E2
MLTVFSSTGCIRCEIVKKYLRRESIPFTEWDVKTDEGREAFKVFYRRRRAEVRRDDRGIFFPVVLDGETVVQDAGLTLAWLLAGEALCEAVVPNNLGHGWTGGLYTGRCGSEFNAVFLRVVRLLKNGGLRTECQADGRNPALLEALLQEKLMDRLRFAVLPAADSGQDQRESLRLAGEHAHELEMIFYTDIAVRTARGGDMLSVTEVAEAARLLREATGNGALAYAVCAGAPELGVNLLQYRTAARRWQTRAELVQAMPGMLEPE